MGDMEKVAAECDRKYGNADPDAPEISDACARVLASWHYAGQSSLGYSFVSTGAIPEDIESLYRELFPDQWRRFASEAERRQADMFGTYIVANGPRGPVEGWSNLWV